MHVFKEIIDFKVVRNWFLVVIAYFLCGYATRAYFGFFTLFLFFYLYYSKKYEYMLYLLILWIYIYEYFNGIRYLPENSVTINITPFLGVVIIAIHMLGWKGLFYEKFYRKIIYAHIVFITFILLSNIINGIGLLKLLRFFTYFILFLAISISNFEIGVYRKIYNQIIAIGLFQIPIAMAQYLKILPAPKIRDLSISHMEVDIQLHLDDAACGTFGPASSPDLSLFLTFLSFLFIIQFIISKKYIFLYIGIFLLLQYVVVDSKTVLGITILIGSLIFLINKNLRDKLLKIINFKILLIVVVFSAGFYISIKKYYERGLYEDNESKLEDIQYMLDFTKDVVVTHIDEWGKIKGFTHVAKLQEKKGGIKNVIFGFGSGETWYRSVIQKKTYHRFFIGGYANHFLDTSSTMITLFAEIGIVGLLLFILIFLVLLKSFPFYKSNFVLLNAYQYLLPAFVLGILVYSFINKELRVNDTSIITFWFFLALSMKFKFHEEQLREV